MFGRVPHRLLFIFLVLLMACEQSPEVPRVNSNGIQLDICGEWVIDCHIALSKYNSHLHCGTDSLSIDSNFIWQRYFEIAANDCDTGTVYGARTRGTILFVNDCFFRLVRDTTLFEDFVICGPYSCWFEVSPGDSMIHCRLKEDSILVPTNDSLRFGSDIDASDIDEWTTFWVRGKPDSTI